MAPASAKPRASPTPSLRTSPPWHCPASDPSASPSAPTRGSPYRTPPRARWRRTAPSSSSSRTRDSATASTPSCLSRTAPSTAFPYSSSSDGVDARESRTNRSIGPRAKQPSRCCATSAFPPKFSKARRRPKRKPPCTDSSRQWPRAERLLPSSSPRARSHAKVRDRRYLPILAKRRGYPAKRPSAPLSKPYRRKRGSSRPPA